MEPWNEAVRLWDKNKDGKLVREEVDNKEVLDRFFRIDLNQDLGLDKEEWGKYASVFEKARNAFFALRPAAHPSANANGVPSFRPRVARSASPARTEPRWEQSDDPANLNGVAATGRHGTASTPLVFARANAGAVTHSAPACSCFALPAPLDSGTVPPCARN